MRKSVMALFALSIGLGAAEPDATWAPMHFLVGKWKAENGGFSFTLELNSHTLVRRNINNTPGQQHQDLMVVYQENGPKAIYFDSEGHVIRYSVSFPARDSAVFESEGGGPKYRLSYALHADKLDGKFEVNGKPYLQWTSTKEK